VKLPDGTYRLPDGTVMPASYKPPVHHLPGFARRNRVPEGSKPLPDGSLQLPNGMVLLPDGSMKMPDGSVKLPDGRLKRQDGTFAEARADGSYALSDGTVLLPNGDIKLANGDILKPDGAVQKADGTFLLPDGSVAPLGYRPPEYNLPCFGAVTLPSGTVRLADGSQKLPNGMILRPDGTMLMPDGSVKLPDGRLVLPDGTFAKPRPDGAYALTDGTVLLPDGGIQRADGTILTPDGSVIHPDGSVLLPDGTTAKAGHVLPSYALPGFTKGAREGGVGELHERIPGAVKLEDGSISLPNGMVVLPDGTVRLPDGSVKLPDGRLRRPDGTFATPNADGTFDLTDGTKLLPNGGILLPTGAIRMPDNTVILPDGTVKLPDGSLAPPGYEVPDYGLPCFRKAKFTCKKCGLPIIGTVLKANLIEGAWHPECFTCTKCGTPVATEGGALACFMEDGEPRCDNCRTKRVCTACEKQIEGQAINAMDKSWCASCFNCAKCQKPIAAGAAGGEFKIQDGQPICEACREVVFCAACGKEIEEHALTAMDKNWHLECFKCSKCDKAIDTGIFKIEGGRPVCEDCRQRLNCAGCGMEIDGQALTALGAHWHPNCFTCSKCGDPVAANGEKLSCAIEGGRPVCAKCRKVHTCASCGEKIKGQVMTALGKKWHPDCFKCGKCDLKITGAFFHKDGVPFCSQECFPQAP